MRFLSTEPDVLSPRRVERLVKRLAALASGEPVVLMYLHGAHARGTQSPLSDVDIAVLAEPAAVGDRRFELDFLSRLQVTCGRDDVDLVILNTAGSIIKDRVVRHGRVIYARGERDRVLFEASAIKEALDFEHLSRVYDKALFRELAEGRFLGRP
jgi:hypothetical protein